MLNIRCECGKIVCQSDHEIVVLKCRHCKRLIFMRSDEYKHKVTVNPHYINSEQYQEQYPKIQ